MNRETSTNASPRRDAVAGQYALRMLAVQLVAILVFWWCPVPGRWRGMGCMLMSLVFSAAWWAMRCWVLKGWRR